MSSPLRIAIDCRTVSAPKTGDRTYALNLTRALARIDRESLYLLCTAEPTPYTQLPAPNVAPVVIPAGAAGDLDPDHAAKVRAAAGAMADARQVVVHLGAPDEASHRFDRAGKVAALEAIDAQVLGPLREEVGARGGVLEVVCDHGTDPATGEHLADPVPSLRWGAGVGPAGPSRFVERALAEEVRAA